MEVSLCKLVIKQGANKALLLGSRAMKATIVFLGKVLALAIRLQEDLLAMKQSTK